jgi:hypothetical protein
VAVALAVSVAAIAAVALTTWSRKTRGVEALGSTTLWKHTKNYGKSPFLMGKSAISMAIFNSYVYLPEGNPSQYETPPGNI